MSVKESKLAYYAPAGRCCNYMWYLPDTNYWTLGNTPDNIFPVFDYSDVLLDILVGGAVVLFKRAVNRKRGKRTG